MAAAVAAVGEAAAAAAKKRAASRSWILFDASGDERVLDADKYAIMHRVDINARDLRILDPLLSYPSTILGRERAIVLNLEVRALLPVPHRQSCGFFSPFWVGFCGQPRRSAFPGRWMESRSSAEFPRITLFPHLFFSRSFCGIACANYFV